MPGPALVDGKYRLTRRLGQGGMGVVFKARHLGLQRDFALKLLNVSEALDEKALARFRQEAEALGRLKHRNIVDVTDFGIDPHRRGLPYLVTELLEGEPLSDRLASNGALPVADALRLLEPIAEAVDFAHGHGVLHRDLKPQNLFVCAGDPVGSIKLLDFGLACFGEQARFGPRPSPPTQPPPVVPEEEVGALPTLDMPLETPSTPLALARNLVPTELGSVGGTPLYMAPERLTQGASTIATDIYALGVVAYQMLVGHPPFEGGLKEVLGQHVGAAPPSPSGRCPGLPQELDAAIVAPLAKDPSRRPASARDLLAGLRSADLAARVNAWRAAELMPRIGMALALAIALAFAAPALERWEPVARLEGSLVDARFAGGRPTPPDPRLVILLLDDASLAGMPEALGQAETAEAVAHGLETVFAAGARGVSIDVLLPQAWSRAPGFSRLVLAHAEGLTLAAMLSPTAEAVGPEVLSGLTATALGPDRARRLFGFVNVEADTDGVVRCARGVAGGSGDRLEAWALRTANVADGGAPKAIPHDCGGSEASPRFWIDYTIDVSRLPIVTWRELPRVLASDPGRLRGKVVLFGQDTDVSGDRHRVPASAGRAEWSGVVLQAAAAHTVLSRFPVRRPGGGGWAFVLGAVAVFGGALCAPRARPFVALGAVAAVAYLLVAFAVFRDARLLLPVAAPLLLFGGGLAASAALRLRLVPFPR